MVIQSATSGGAAAQSIFNSMPCEPANILAIARILNQKDPSLHSLGPFFEQDLVLSLKVISAANEMMKGRSAKVIAVRNVPHALSIIGFNGISDIIEASSVGDFTDQAALHFQVYRFTLARTQFLLNLIQCFSQFHPSLHVDDIRIYVSVLMFAQLELARDKSKEAHTLFYLYQRDLTEFWDTEMELLDTTLIDRAVRLTQHYCLPREMQQALDVMPGLEQFYYSGTGLSLKKVHGFFRRKEKEQDIALSVIIISYVLVHRAPPFWGDRPTQYMIHWLSRFLNRPVGDIWRVLQREFLRGARKYPMLDGVGRSLMAQRWPQPLKGVGLDTCIAKYAKTAGIDKAGGLISLQEAKTKPPVKSLVQTILSDLPADVDQTLLKEVKVPRGKKAPSEADRQPGDGIERFIATLRQNPKAYGTKLPTSSALLETLRIGLDVEFCISLFFDEQKQNFWVGNVSGLASRHPVRKWTVQKEGAGLLQHFLVKPAGVWIQGDKRQSLLKALPKMIVSIIGESEAFMSTTTNSQKIPTGIIIAVARIEEKLSKACYQAFQKATLIAPL